MTLAALALAAASQSGFVTLTLENDFFAGYDRHYTNGLQVAWTSGPDVVYAIGQRIYTPADTGRELPDFADRPYAGWLYGLADIRRQHGEATDHLTITAGIVGPASGARQTQSAAHRLLQEEQSRGWGAQLKNEPTLGLGFERTWPSTMRTRFGKQSLDFSPRVGATIGNALTYANVGAVVRFGENLPNDVPAYHISLGPSRDGFRGTPLRGWYVWTGVDGRAVARNMFLEGNTNHELPSVDRKPYGYDVQGGIVYAAPDMRIGFSVVRRSREFDGQPSADRFGQLTVSWAY